MTLYMGPNTGLLINGAPGEGHYSELIRMGTRTFSLAPAPIRTA